MNNVKRVLKASAGTGKTYRLSLEYINALLQFKGELNFDEILVLTFTKKATAEIRLRILKFLKILTYTGTEEEILEEKENFVKSLKDIREDFFLDEKFLREQYENMLKNKNRIQIFTIDSFTNSIFRSLIAPFKNLSDYKIDENINDEYFDEIFEEILNDRNLADLETIFIQKRAKNLTSYQDFIKKVLNNKWLFDEITIDNSNNDENKNIALESYKSSIKKIVKTMFVEISAKKKIKDDFSSYFPKFINSIFEKKYLISSKNIQLANFEEFTYKNFTNENFLTYHSEEIISKGKIWNGTQFRKKDVKQKLLAQMEEVETALSFYLLITKAIPEQKVIFNIAKKIIRKYEEIKLRDRIFTFNDISNFTYQNLYGNDENSLLERTSGNIINYFYEKLSYKIKFLLIDEFQDTSVIQWRILYPIIKELLSAENRGVVIVGDEKQSIYNWRGGKRDLLMIAPNELNTEGLNLSTSYRSRKTIVDFVNKVFMNETFSNQNEVIYDYENVKANKKEEGYVEVNFENISEVNGLKKRNKAIIFDKIVQQIAKLEKEDKIELKKTAVFCRSNNELQQFAEKLIDHNIEFLLESSETLFQYKAIKPIFFLLNFIESNNFRELARFLRSDFVLLPTNSLKIIFQHLKEIFDETKDRKQEIVTITEFFKTNKRFKIIQKIEKIYRYQASNSLIFLIKKIFEEFNLFQLFPTELDSKNLFKFLKISTEFTQKDHRFQINLSGFLKYCQRNESTIIQEGLEEKNALQLLTIHKSKGLEFDTVFTIFNFGRGSSNDETFFVNFTDNYLGIENFALTYNYKKLIRKALPNRVLKNFEEQYYEILNIFYVAITRPKNNLFIYNIFSNKDSSLQDHYKKYRKEIEKKKLKLSNANKVFFNTLYKTCKNNFSIEETAPNSFVSSTGKLEIVEKKITTKNVFKNDCFHEYFNFINLEKYKQNEIIENRDYNKIYIENRKQLKGTIAHYYLSFIEFPDEKINNFAKLKTLNEYGNIIPEDEILKIISKSDEVFENFPEIFSSQKWNKIFNEYSIFDENNNEFIIDRLLIDCSAKEILIVDYKTGDFEEKQIENYKKLISELKFVERENYSIKGKYITI